MLVIGWLVLYKWNITPKPVSPAYYRSGFAPKRLFLQHTRLSILELNECPGFFGAKNVNYLSLIDSGAIMPENRKLSFLKG
jgi:hypothetical protein